MIPVSTMTSRGNEDDPKKFQKKIRVNFMGMVTDPQTAKVIWEKNVIMKHPKQDITYLRNS